MKKITIRFSDKTRAVVGLKNGSVKILTKVPLFGEIPFTIEAKEVPYIRQLADAAESHLKELEKIGKAVKIT